MFVDPAHPSTGPITALAVSPNGLYLASASDGQRGEVWVWSIEKKRVLWRCGMIIHIHAIRCSF
jgi:chromosome transmission fidelity protein 4